MPLIYQIVRKSDESCVYIGSTKDSLRKRIINHLKDSKKKSHKLYQIINDEGWDAFDFMILEEVDLEENLLWIERFYIEALNPQGNQYMPILTKQELQERQKTLRQDWRARIYRCECGKRITYNNLVRHRKTDDHILNLD